MFNDPFVSPILTLSMLSCDHKGAEKIIHTVVLVVYGIPIHLISYLTEISGFRSVSTKFLYCFWRLKLFWKCTLNKALGYCKIIFTKEPCTSPLIELCHIPIHIFRYV